MDQASRHLTLTDFDFVLPPELIAQAPAATRSGSRLLHVDGMARHDRRFTDLPSLLQPGDLLVFNDTRVLRARVRGRKPTGGQVELLLERLLAGNEALAQWRASHPPRVGTELELPAAARALVIARDGRFVHLRFEGAGDLVDWLERHGDVPLPPYIDRPARAVDDERYQTIYAKVPGAVAAPTAGLHFDEQLLASIAARQVATATLTLHIGAGTFQPVIAEDLARHRMHSEWYSLPATTVAAIAATRARGGRVVAVGTTTLRALESATLAAGGMRAGAGETSLFVTPGFTFGVVDRLVTNFHLPKSTLLMLVSAFAGYDEIRAAYAHAIRERYRFFSYGDAMLLERRAPRGVTLNPDS